MLTVNPAKRANITDIASHWWINKDCNALDEELTRTTRRTSDYFEDDSVFCDIPVEKCDRIVTPVFDSDKKPKKGILKNRKTKMSSGDSGCGLSDTTRDADNSSSQESALSDLPSAESDIQETLARMERPRDSISSESSGDALDFSYESTGSNSPADSD